MEQQDMADLLLANSRRAIMKNQLGLAERKRDSLLRIGYKGGLFEANQGFLAVLGYHLHRDDGWGTVLLDLNNIPIGLTCDELKELHDNCYDAYGTAMRTYYSDYTRIVEASKSDLVKDLGETAET